MKTGSFAALACGLAMAHDAHLQGAEVSEMVYIRKAGYPEERVGERSACGQRQVHKSVLDPDYFMHVVVGGFREGTCAEIGYATTEKSVSVGEHSLPFTQTHNVSYDVFSRDPTLLDVAECMGRECGTQLSSIVSSRYVNDVAHCVSPAFGECVPKAWTCLGDEACRSALECMPNVVKTCGPDVWNVITDPVERKKVSCVVDCDHKTSCVLLKCGKEALDCLTGIDQPCHKALTCPGEELLKCSKPAWGCIFGKDGVCRDNLGCVTKGASVCADPAVNLLTDTSMAGLVTCANQRCPAPAGSADMLASSEVSAAAIAATLQGAQAPKQLACMGLKCAGKVASLLMDKDVKGLTTCMAHGVTDGCGEKIFDCLDDASCRAEVQCWSGAVGDEAAVVWKMVSDEKERAFDEDLYVCLTDCSANSKHPFAKAFCVASKCGRKAVECMADSTCRSVFTGLPSAAAKCTLSSIKDPKFRETFVEAASCVAKISDSCGRAGIELLRDTKLADLVSCNSQCTVPPTAGELIV